MAEEQLDDYFYGRYNLPPVAPPSPVAGEVAAWLAGNTGAAAPVESAEIEAATVKAGDHGRTTDAQNILADQALPVEQKVAELQPLAADMGTASTTHAQMGLYDLLRTQEGPDTSNPLYSSAKQWNERRKANLEAAHQSIELFIAGERDKLEGKTPAAGVVNTLRESVPYVARLFLSPDSVIHNVNIAKEFFPDVSWSDYVLPAQLYTRLGRKIAESDPETSKKVVTAMIAGIKQRGLLGQDNTVERIQELQTLLSGLDGDLKGGSRFLTNLGAAASYLGPIGAVVDAVTAPARAARGLVSVASKIGQPGRVVTRLAGDPGAYVTAAEAVRLNPGKILPEATKQAKLDRAAGRPDVLPTPKITAGSTADAATATVAGAKQGVRIAASSDVATSVTAADARGTTPEQLMGSLVLPKLEARLDDLGRPYVDPIYITDDMAAEVEAMSREALKDVLQTRLKDVVVGERTADGNGFNYTAQVGRGNGMGYTTADEAAEVAREQFGPTGWTISTTAAPQGAQLPAGTARAAWAGVSGTPGQHFITLQGVAAPTVNMIRSNADLVKYPLLSRLGRAVGFSNTYNELASRGLFFTAKAQAVVNDHLKPYLKFPSWRRAKINSLIEKQDVHGFVYERPTDAAAEGLDAEEFVALNKLNNLADLEYNLTEFNVRHQLKAQDYRYGSVGGEAMFAKPIAVSADPNFLKSAKLVDQSGRPTTYTVGDDVYSITETTPKGYTHVVVKQGQTNPLSLNYPPKVIKKYEGYRFRKNEWPYYVYNADTGETLHGAGSRNQAQRTIAQLNQTTPGNYKTRLASEIDPTRRGILSSDLERAKEQGLLATSHRKVSRLTDIAGNERVTGVEEGITTAARRYADSAGMGRWVETTMADLNSRLKAIDHRAEMSLGREPVLPRGALSLEDQKVVADAEAVFKHVELVSGTSPISVSKSIAAARLKLADAMYNWHLDTLGNNLSGLTNGFERFAKSTGFYVYLGSNFTRNPLTQTSMIPLYGALRGVGKYALSGEMTFDLARLGQGVLRDVRPDGDAGKLFDIWKDTGLSANIQNHTLLSQTLFDSKLRLPGIGGTLDTAAGLADDSIGALLRGMQKVGFDAGITLDKMGAMTAVVRRFRADRGGKWPTTQEDMIKIFHDTEELTLNQNPSDPLAMSRGALGVVMQFMSFTVKASGRLLALEGNWSKAERVRFAAMQMLSYGADGLKAGAFVAAAEQATGYELDPHVRELVKRGYYGTMLNTLMGAATDPKQELEDWATGNLREGRADVSAAISPYNFVGSTIQSLTQLFDANTRGVALGNLLPPIANFTGDIIGAMHLGYLLTNSGLQMKPAEIRRTVMTDFLRKVPITNSVFRAYVGANYGYSVDGSGNPVQDATKREALASIMGIQSLDERGLRELETAHYGHYSGGQDDDVLYDATAKEAKTNAKWIIKGLREITEDNAGQLEARLADHTDAYAEMLGWSAQARNIYFATLSRAVADSGVTRSERIVATWIKHLDRGKIAIGANVLNEIDQTEAPEEVKQRLKQHITDQMDIAAGIKLMLKGDNDGQ